MAAWLRRFKAAGSKSRQVLCFGTRLSRERLAWYLAMARLTRDGVPVFDAVQTLAHEFEKIHHPLTPLLRAVLLRLRGETARERHAQAIPWGRGQGQQWLHGQHGQHGQHGVASVQRVQHGQSSMKRRRTLGFELQGLVPSEEALLIEAADLSGDVALGLESAAQRLGERRELEAALARALVKPLGYAAALLALMVYFSIDILPQFERYKARRLWPQELQFMAFCADHVGSVVLGLLVLGFKLWAGFGAILPRWHGRARDQFDRFVFPFNVYASLSAAQLLSAIAGFVSAGLPFAQAVELIAMSATPYLSHQCHALLLSLKRGLRPEKALSSLVMIAPEWRWMIVAHAMNADTAVSMRRMAQEMQARVKKLLEFVFGDLLGNAMLLGVGVAVFWIYSSMMNLVQSSP